MDLFAARRKAQVVTLKPADVLVAMTQGGMPVRTPVPGVRVKFNPLLDGGVRVSGLPAKKDADGQPMALSILTVDEGVKQTGMERDEFVEAMRAHGDYGTEFILMTPGEAADVPELPEPEGDQSDLPIGVIKASDGYYCLLCEKRFKAKNGLFLHVDGANSGKHKAALERYEAVQRAGLAKAATAAA